MSATILGEVRDMPAEQYHAIEALSASGMRELSRSAWHFKNRRQITPTKAMLSGTLVHCAQLEPEALAARYVVVPADAPRRPVKAQRMAKNPSPDSIAAMNWWDNFAAQCGSRLIISAEDFELCRAQLAAIQAEPELRELFASGYGETSVFWIDSRTGVYCKARPDWVSPVDARTVDIVDLKSTANESPNLFSRTVANMGYHRQQEHYIKGFEQATGKKVRRFIFAAVTGSQPCLAVPYELDDIAAKVGRDECAELAALYARCRESGHWPAYGEGVQLIGLPQWAMPSTELEFSNV